MAQINAYGVIQARCPGCNGALTNFEWTNGAYAYSQGLRSRNMKPPTGLIVEFRLYRCSGCGRGALAHLVFKGQDWEHAQEPSILEFHPESGERAKLVDATPADIVAEFREAERAFEANCNRASAGLFRSVLDKTMEANGLRQKRFEPLADQINRAAEHGLITDSRRRKAHTDIRVLGNDVLHEPWREVPSDEVELSRHYAQRILEDFYDDRPNVLKKLRDAKLTPREDDPNFVPPVVPLAGQPAVSKAPPPINPL